MSAVSIHVKNTSVAVNLLELSEIKEALYQLKSNDVLAVLPRKEQCSYVTGVFQKIAEKSVIELKLIKK